MTLSAPLLPWLPDPYTMCSRQECEDRDSSGEVSRLESSTCTTTSCSISSAKTTSGVQHNLDPRRAVAKYRRNERRYPPRTLPQLEVTVRYLSELLLMDRDESSSSSGSSFLSVVDFVQDRLRAVQVDVTRQSASAPQLQQPIARLHVIVLYLLHDCPAYEHKFGQAALHMSLAQYWNSLEQQQRRGIMDDEMFSCTLLVQLNEQLMDICQQQKYTSNGVDCGMPRFCFALTELYRRHGHRLPPGRTYYLEWTLRLVSLIVMGHWQTALQHLLIQRARQTNISDNERVLLPTPTDWLTFQRLAQCCLAPSIPWMRWQTLYTWNNCIGVPPANNPQPRRRNEGLSGTELARLLCYETAEMALAFAAEFLPVNDDDDDDDDDNDNDNNDNRRIRFKGQAIQPFRPPSSLRATMDSVVLANYHNSNDGSSNKKCDNAPVLRSTSDGILLPSAEWMRTMLRCHPT